MKPGKVSEPILKRSVLRPITYKRPEVLAGAGVGIDSSVIKIGEDEVFVCATDPIPYAGREMGNATNIAPRLAVNAAVNDIAAAGAEPIGILVTIFMPDSFLESELKEMMCRLHEICEQMHIQIIGGHTEVTDAVNRPIFSLTAVGAAKEEYILRGKNLKAGQDIVMTKTIGLEETVIIASEKEAVLKERFAPMFINRAKALSEQLSVVCEAVIARRHGAVVMHDMAEGGIFGALWELGVRAESGLEVDLKAIAVKQETIEFCELLNINPYRMKSGGSLLIVTDCGNSLVQDLEKEGIRASVIGNMKKGKDRIIINGEEKKFLVPPREVW